MCLFFHSGCYRRVPPEMRVDPTTWLLGDIQFPEVDMRRLILDLVDERIFGIRPGQDDEADNERAWQDKVEQYEQLEEQVRGFSRDCVCMWQIVTAVGAVSECDETEQL